MATVTVEINGRPYAVGCADGQEDRVRQLAAQFAGHVSTVAAEVGHVGELRLFLMAGLILADELQEARSGEAPARPAEAPSSDAGVAEALNAVAARIEKIAQTIT